MKICPILVFSLSAVICQGVTFNRDLVSVVFDPFIFPGDFTYPYDVYDSKDITKMLETISSKFTKVLMYHIQADGYTRENSRALIPSVAANFNKHRDKNQSKIELIMTFYYDENVLDNFDLQTELVDEANSISIGTVSTIILQAYSQSFQDVGDSLSYFKEEMDSLSFPYKLGAKMAIDNCYRPQISHILQYTDVIIFAYDDAPQSYSIDGYFSSVTKSLTDCHNSILSMRKNVKVEFLVYRSELQLGDTHNYNYLVKFWDQMNQWASKNNINVILLEAFDNFVVEDQKLDCVFCGWWRASHSKSGSLLDFVLEEKATGISEYQKPTFTKFNRDNFMVMFGPWVHPAITEYDHSSLLNMLQTISSRFSKVVTKEFLIVKENLVPSAVAHWNGNRTADSAPMEVLMSCSLKLPDDKKYPTDFDVAKNLADKANAIYPGTVKSFAFEYYYLDFSTLNLVKANLLYSRKKIAGQSASNYTIGMLLLITDCGSSRLNLNENLIPLLPLMDFVYFGDLPVNTLELDIAFTRTFRRFERCLLKIRKINQRISVGFWSRWPDTNDEGVQNIPDMVDYWVRANHWAEKVNTTVIMVEAFDNPLRLQGKTLGWWTLDRNSFYRDQSQFEFVEKAANVQGDPIQVPDYDPDSDKSDLGTEKPDSLHNEL